ncbi:neutral ceramidase, partial [Lecanoromycetidae sp. Uapishka_2]
MARFHIAAALATAAVVLILISQLLSTFGWPKIDFLALRYDSLSTGSAPNQFAINGPASEPAASTKHGAKYLLGVGKADITGPVVEINMMGYADPAQVGSGLRQRLYSKAFIVGDIDNPEDRFLYLVLDTQSGDTAVRYGILEGLAELGEAYGLYGQKNVAVTGTHSHSGPGAWLNYLLPQITSKGFNKQSYQAIVDGALLSIQRAHENLKPGHLDVGYVEIEDANINRSLFAYLANPAKERKRYKHDVDKILTMLKFWNAENSKSMGVLTWFPVHGTSMLGNNTLITGDNKGVAAHSLEQAIRGTEGADDGFVAGFSQANVGDTSPNVLGAYCEDGSEEECNFEDSTCGGKNEPCHGRGPMFREKDQGASSCYEIGKRQAVAAHSLYDLMIRGGLVGTPVRGSTVKALHSFHDFSSFSFLHPNGSMVSTCPAALGYSFAAGTTDGPGAFDFKQNNTGSPNANPVWSVVSGFLREPSEEQKACHHSKPILLDVGEIENPYLWTPNIVDVQMFRVGQLIIIVSPGEATTMAGRRWKEAIHEAAGTSSLTEGVEPIVVLGGPANSYTHYIATEEEYGIQRYEGASTLYGPHTLNAHIEITRSYLPYLGSGSTSSPPPGPEPPIYTNESMSFITGVAFDRAPFFKSFGEILTDVESSYTRGTIAKVSFVGANPRNDLRLEDTYASVERRNDGGGWVRVRDDADWSLIFKWKRTNSVLATSEVEIVWEIEDEAEEGTYRIRYSGASKTPISGEIVQFEGISGTFEVV